MKTLLIGIAGIILILLVTLSITNDFKTDNIRDQNRKTADSCISEKKKLVGISQNDVDSMKYWTHRLDIFYYSQKEFEKYQTFYARVEKRSKLIDEQAKTLDSIFNIANK